MKARRFISEAIEVDFDEPLASCVDFGRTGRMSGTMQPERAEVAAGRGSWGVGRFHFRVRTRCGRLFDLYYDRAPSLSGGDRKGGWFLFRELEPDNA